MDFALGVYALRDTGRQHWWSQPISTSNLGPRISDFTIFHCYTPEVGTRSSVLTLCLMWSSNSTSCFNNFKICTVLYSKPFPFVFLSACLPFVLCFPWLSRSLYVEGTCEFHQTTTVFPSFPRAHYPHPNEFQRLLPKSYNLNWLWLVDSSLQC